MNVLIVYYSYEGATQLIAEHMKEVSSADLLQLKVVDEKQRTGFGKYFWNGQQVMMKKKPALEPYTLNPSDYDLIVIGTPIWAGTFTPAIRTFLEDSELSGKKVAYFYTDLGGSAKMQGHMDSMLVDSEIVGRLNLVAVRKDEAGSKKKAEEWIRSLIQ